MTKRKKIAFDYKKEYKEFYMLVRMIVIHIQKYDNRTAVCRKK